MTTESEGRRLLLEAQIAMQAFTNPEGNMPEDTGEFRDLKRSLANIDAFLAQPEDEVSMTMEKYYYFLACEAECLLRKPAVPERTIHRAIVASAIERGWSHSGSWAVADGAIKLIAAAPSPEGDKEKEK